MLKKIIRFLLEPVFRERIYIKRVLNNNFPSKFLEKHLMSKYNIVIPRSADISNDVWLPHPHNIIFGEKTSIGKGCIIYHDVTLGQNRGKYPQIRNNVIIYAGAKIIGDIVIGNNVIIGANSVVNKSIPDNMIVAGVPAVIIGERKCEDEFY